LLVHPTRRPLIGMSDLIAADPDVPDGFHLRASRATIPPGGTVLGVLTLFDACSYQRWRPGLLPVMCSS